MSFNYKRNAGESDYDYKWRIYKHKMYDDCQETWDEIACYLNDALFPVQFDSDEKTLTAKTYRNEASVIARWWENVFVKSDNTDPDDLQSKIDEIKREQVKLRDERTSNNKTIRTNARNEKNLELLAESLVKIGESWNTSQEKYYTGYQSSDEEILVLLSDWHIGIEFDNHFGSYSVDIAKRRLSELLNELTEISSRHNANKCTIAVLGDMISGNIHRSIDMQNRQNVIEQLKHAVELLSWFIVQAEQLFNKIDVVCVCGNHSRITQKDDAAIDERLDNLIPWAIDMLFKTHPCVSVIESENATLAHTMIFGRKYVFCHGDMDQMTQKGISQLSFMMNEIPYAVCAGHLHYPMMTVVNGVYAIQSGCLSGTGDDYTLSKRLTGMASQTILVCSENGIQGYYPVILK